MGDMEQGQKDLIDEVVQLIAGAFKKETESEEFQERFDEINQRMFNRYGQIIGSMFFSAKIFITAPLGSAAEEGEKARKSGPSVNFRFGGSKEDESIGKTFGLAEGEMNRLLEQARNERTGEKTATPASKKTMGEEKTAESADTRNVSQIINSIREIARSLNVKQRRFFVRTTRENIKILRLDVIIDEHLQNDTVWLQSIQEIIDKVKKWAEEYGKSREETKETFLALEEVFIVTQQLREYL
jgi:hypothetical protein